MPPTLTLVPIAGHPAGTALPGAPGTSPVMPPRYQVMTVPLERIAVSDPLVTPSAEHMDRRQIAPLVRSVRETGRLNLPIFLRRLQEAEPKRYAVLDGLPWVAAVREVGLTEVDVVVVDIDDLEALRVAVCARVTAPGRAPRLPLAWLVCRLWLAERAADPERRQRHVAERVGLRESDMSTMLAWARALPEPHVAALARAAGVALERIETMSRAHIRALVDTSPEARSALLAATLGNMAEGPGIDVNRALRQVLERSKPTAHGPRSQAVTRPRRSRWARFIRRLRAKLRAAKFWARRRLRELGGKPVPEPFGAGAISAPGASRRLA